MSDTMRSDQVDLVVFGKCPVPGLAKRRLAAVVGEEEAMRVYRRLFFRTVHCAQQTGLTFSLSLEGWDKCVDEDRLKLAAIGCPVTAQRGMDLGERMHQAMLPSLVRGRGVVLIGTDLVNLDVEAVREAAHCLAQGASVVLAPSEDGGYGLLALNEDQPELFSDMPWSTSTVLSETLRRAQGETILLATVWDVDTLEDYQRLCGDTS